MNRLTLLLVFISMVTLQCQNKNCYDLNLKFGRNSSFEKNSPIFIGNGIVGYVEDFHEADSTTVVICVPKPLKIPKDSKVMEGHIKRVGTNGIEILLGKQSEVLKGGDTMIGVHKDTIQSNSAEGDSAAVNKLINIMQDFGKKHKPKK